jgi:hypothetical protein
VRSLRFLVPLGVAAGVLVAAASATPAAQQLTFTQLAHGSVRIGSTPFGFAPALGTSLLLADGPNDLADETDQSWAALGVNHSTVESIRATDWRRRFVFGVFTAWPTRGYDVRIQRITVQHIGGGAQQLCVTVSRHGPRPGQVVLQERTSVYELVQVRRESANLPAPESVVIRGIHGRLLYVNTNTSPGGFNTTNHPVRPDVCHPS